MLCFIWPNCPADPLVSRENPDGVARMLACVRLEDIGKGDESLRRGTIAFPGLVHLQSK